MQKFVLCLFAAVLWLGAQGASQAASSGTALGVDPGASAKTASETRVLTVGADIFIGDRVITDANGLVQIKFADKTELVVGPRSSLVIEDYLLREDGSIGKLAIDALAGTFRFTTGTAPKDRYIITTPTGTIGVRGTSLDVNVSPANTTVLVFHGAVILCNLNNECEVIDDQCEVGEADTSQTQIVGITDEISGAAREALRSLFPYAVSEADLLGAFRVDQARRCLNRSVQNTAPGSITNRDTSEPPVGDGGGDGGGGDGDGGGGGGGGGDDGGQNG